jgi:ribosomal protein S18 acetylase RimI-like enzyme
LVVRAMSVSIRKAGEEDSPFIAWVELAAARSHLPRGFFDVSLDTPEDQTLAIIGKICDSEVLSFAHWSGFLVAEIDGIPAAGLSGYDPAERDTETFVTAVQDGLARSGWEAAEIEAAFERLTPFVTCSMETPPDCWVVEWVATRAEFRGRGLVRSLLEAILEEGRRRGFGQAQISLLLENHPAQRAYESAGFKVEEEKRHPLFEETFGSPGMLRMMRAL